MIVKVLTSVVTGASLALLSPLLGWPSPAFRFPMLALIGAPFTLCSVWITSVVASLIIGTSAGALLWQLGLCAAGSWSHSGLLACFAILFAGGFSCHPRAEPVFQWLLIVLGALLVVESVGPRVPGVPMLTSESLLAVDSCPPGDDSFGKARATGVAWLLLASFAAALHMVLLRSEPKEETNPELTSSLLNSVVGGAANAHKAAGAKDAGEGAFNAPDKEQSLNRHMIICKAMYSEDESILSQLTDHERALVEICRDDEDQRNRILYGGGLW